MYNDFFGIAESPFSLTPDPSYLYLTEKHRTALAHLLYSARGGGGFTVLTGEVGTGKTTLCRAFLEQLPEQVDSALILNPRLSESELLASICDELGVDAPKNNASIKDLIDALNGHLLELYRQGRDIIVLIDEAQNLSPAVLEQIRLLTNLETSKRKLLQIVLVGQPELNDMLARNDLRQLAQRITARYHLDTLNREETASLIRYRLTVAGLSDRTFDGASLTEIHHHAGGVARLIVILAERCLLGAYAEGIRTVDRRMVQTAVREVIIKRRRVTWRRAAATLGAAAIALFVVPASVKLLEPASSRPPAMRAYWLNSTWANSEWAMPEQELLAITQPKEAIGRPATLQKIAAPKDEVARDEKAVLTQRELEGIEVDKPSAATLPQADLPPNAWPRTALASVGKSSESLPLVDAVLRPTAADHEIAFARLLGFWVMQHDTNDEASPCDKAVSIGRASVNRTDGWNELLHVIRPAGVLLSLQDDVSRPIPLERIEVERARVMFGDCCRWLGRDELALLWGGNLLGLWRSPFTLLQLVRAGNRDGAMLSLRRALGEPARGLGRALLRVTLAGGTGCTKCRVARGRRDRRADDHARADQPDARPRNRSRERAAIPSGERLVRLRCR